jgi:hypothetical protein
MYIVILIENLNNNIYYYNKASNVQLQYSMFSTYYMVEYTDTITSMIILFY